MRGISTKLLCIITDELFKTPVFDNFDRVPFWSQGCHLWLAMGTEMP